MLEDRTLATARRVAGRLLDGLDPGHWVQPSYKWINGVPGCGKTTWIEKHFKTKHDIAVTVTVEAAKDLRSRTAAAAGKQDKNRVHLTDGTTKRGTACNKIYNVSSLGRTLTSPVHSVSFGPHPTDASDAGTSVFVTAFDWSATDLQ
ncbi:hypothetical protein ACJJTC_000288 [Scirpophaga incertulas]